MAAHRVTEYSTAIGADREMGFDQLGQLQVHIAAHAIVRRPRRGTRIEIEPGAHAKVPGGAVAGQIQATRTGVAGHQRQAVLRGQSQRTGLDHEGLLAAGQPREVVQRRNLATLCLGRQIQPETHVGADDAASVAIETDAPAMASLFAAPLHRHGHCPRRTDRWLPDIGYGVWTLLMTLLTNTGCPT